MSRYPYGELPLKFGWDDRRAWAFAFAAMLGAGVATALQWPVGLARVDDWALRVVLPAMLAIVLAFAPRPGTLVGRIAKDLTVAGIIAAIFGGDLVPLMVVCYPAVLATSVLLGESRLGARLWGEGRQIAAE